jgi:hypothetical protein
MSFAFPAHDEITVHAKRLPDEGIQYVLIKCDVCDAFLVPHGPEEPISTLFARWEQHLKVAHHLWPPMRCAEERDGKRCERLMDHQGPHRIEWRA